MKVKVKKEKGYMYFIDKRGDVSRVEMARPGQKGGRPQKVAKVGVKREPGYLYFIDNNID